MAAGRRAAEDALGQGRLAGERPSRIPAAANGPQGLAEPQRPLGLCHHQQGCHARHVRIRRFWCRSRSSRRCRASCARSARTSASGIGAPSRCPTKWRGRRVLLHFGAVDFEATVWVNGKQVGQHRGGYDAFSFDITDALNPVRRERIDRGRLGPDRRRHAAPRQAGAQAERHLVHAHQRHLADGVAGAGQRRLHH